MIKLECSHLQNSVVTIVNIAVANSQHMHAWVNLSIVSSEGADSTISRESQNGKGLNVENCKGYLVVCNLLFFK